MKFCIGDENRLTIHIFHHQPKCLEMDFFLLIMKIFSILLIFLSDTIGFFQKSFSNYSINAIQTDRLFLFLDNEKTHLR